MKFAFPLPLAALASLACATPALAADRAPTAGEAKAITAVLHDAGFKSWDEIEFDIDDNRWEVDDARDAQGQQWDLHLAPKTYAIVRRERD
ncbi:MULTISPECIES: PepSY domain-containing protein [Sphingobium]|uniref:PepSY domain-containing protein n=1 Tax=Sphingobium TaxID=165695 RepID=UPI0015ECC586|nr:MULTISPECIES: PepSY domain-containing protein [Sphingobium]MCW2362725.1 DICT domain-containing protein [Sphingobium sp. B10D3B]MCW2400595.1 DICT domain-containing protein [Sphingobium sp. B10D7B]MCW2407574.1 DICT domain-containing protein [Sphingobium xanthum]